MTTIVSPFFKGSEYAGVLNFNVLSTSLANSINSLTILDSGYSYLIDAKNSTFIVVHPFASSGCSEVKCAEDFSSSEYEDFLTNVLIPIQEEALGRTDVSGKSIPDYLGYVFVTCHGSCDFVYESRSELEIVLFDSDV